MLRGYFVRRTLSALVTLLGVSVLIFALARVIPGDPARTALGDAATNEQIEAYRAQLRLDDPLPVQYVTYVRGVLRGDLGISLYSGGRVIE
ncbi:MAG: ABC transporter permease, partial [Alphaproteobacteria bacterium]|nr:ABC transporter permease [Alphaproteobacteria bacterium]